MNHLRRCIVFTGAAAGIGALTGCPFGGLTNHNPHSVESVSSVLISADGKNLVVITPEYHYIFENADFILTILRSSFHKYVSADFSLFQVSSFGAVDGEITFYVDLDAPEPEIEKAVSVGFKRVEFAIKTSVKLTGKRYKSNGVEPKIEAYKLNKEYSISVYARQPAGEVLLTPIVAVGDTFVLVLGVLLLPVMLVFVAVKCRNDGCK
jgi:hypothetical protein